MEINGDPVTILVATWIGLLVGSFLNVAAYRLPIGMSVNKPKRSSCPNCGEQITARDNIPVISWMILGGKCRHCSEPISPVYPVVELTTAALFALVAAHIGLEPELAPALVLVSTLIVITVTDFQHRMIPNKVLLPVAVAAIPLQLMARPDDWAELLISGAGAFAFFLIAALVYSGGMGMGDVKLAGVMGLYLGRAVVPGLLIAFLAGTLVGIIVMIKKGIAEGRKSPVPFGPFMALGGVIALFAGDDIVQWYLDSFIHTN